MREWQPIETAPKDGTWILTYGQELDFEPDSYLNYAICCWSALSGGVWETNYDGYTCNPSHWTPLTVPSNADDRFVITDAGRQLLEQHKK